MSECPCKGPVFFGKHTTDCEEATRTKAMFEACIPGLVEPAQATVSAPTIHNCIGLSKSIEGMLVDEMAHGVIRGWQIKLTEMLYEVAATKPTSPSPLVEKWRDNKSIEHRVACRCAACWAREKCADELEAWEASKLATPPAQATVSAAPTIYNCIGLSKSIQGMLVDEEKHEIIRSKQIELTEMLYKVEATKPTAPCPLMDLAEEIIRDYGRAIEGSKTWFLHTRHLTHKLEAWEASQKDKSCSRS